MGTARQDFERFMRWLHDPEQRAPESARRFANLVLEHFDAIGSTARQHNNRSHLLARLARSGHSQTRENDSPCQGYAHSGLAS